MSEQPQSDSHQSINAQDTSIQKSNVGQVIGGNLTQIQGEVINVTVYDSVNIAGLGNRQTSGSVKPLTQQDYRNRKVLLNKVKNFWIEGVLEKSLHVKALIELGLEERLDAVEHPFRDVQDIPDKSVQTLPTGTDITNIFQMGEGRTLLILGEPGAGKTITLLKLTQSLITCAEKDKSLPIPVVFNLSSWESQQQNIDAWLVEELKGKYAISKELGKVWLKKEQLLLLLDGLDEVKAERREDCVQSLNKFLQEYGLTQMVVCSRIRDYETLSNRLKLQGAICIQSLTHEQINQYLERAGEHLETLKTLLQEDTALQELAKSPLTLSVMTLAYQGISVEELPKRGSVEERRKHLFNAYIERMFKRRRASQRYSKAQAMRWLIFLAQRMSQESQTLFLIEKMQPSWLLNNSHKWFYNLVVGMILYSITLFGFCLIYETIFIIFLGLSQGLYTGLILVLCYPLLFFKLKNDSKFNIALDERKNRIIKGINKIDAFETVNFVFSKFLFKKVIKAVYFSLISGLFLGLIIGVFTALISGRFAGFISGLIAGIISQSFCVLILVLLRVIHTLDIEKKTIPNQGIWKSGVNAGIFGLIFGLIGGLIYGLVGMLKGELIFGVIGGLLGGLCLGLIKCGGFSVIQHFTLRLILYGNGYIPWNYARFLDYAVDHIFLQKVGGGYIFVHRLLLEHFAQIEPE